MTAESMWDYSVGQLDDPERRRHEAALRHDPELHRAQNRLNDRLHQLLDDGDHPVPPHELLASTLERVWDAVDREATSEQLWPETVAMPTRTLRLTDLLVAAAILMATALMLIPALRESRSQANLVCNENNLYQLGVAMNSYFAAHDAYPTMAGRDDLAFTGFYPYQLREARFLSDPEVLDCPTAPDSVAPPRPFPNFDDVLADLERDRRANRPLLEHDYVYNVRLGEHRAVGPHRIDLSLAIPMLADQPPHLEDGQILPGNSPNHQGRGQHVLFVDGGVRFFSGRRIGPRDADLYLNAEQRAEPGNDPSDHVLLPGFFRFDGSYLPCCRNPQPKAGPPTTLIGRS